MGIEIERKFLVKNSNYKARAIAVSEISQGYLSRNPDRTVRIRIKDSSGYITVKGRTEGMSRLEFEYPIPLEDARQMLALCEPPVLHKTRYLVIEKGKRWEVDEFHGAKEGLVVAEIELESATERVDIPDFIDKEVTGDSRYYNSQL